MDGMVWGNGAWISRDDEMHKTNMGITEAMITLRQVTRCKVFTIAKRLGVTQERVKTMERGKVEWHPSDIARYASACR